MKFKKQYFYILIIVFIYIISGIRYISNNEIGFFYKQGQFTRFLFTGFHYHLPFFQRIDIYNKNSNCGVIIGDSIAEGHPFSHGRLHNKESKVEFNKPNEEGQISYYFEKFLGIKVYNQGIGSQTSTDVLIRWNRDVLAKTDSSLVPSKTLNTKPCFAVIIVGINDVFKDVKSDVIIKNLNYMIGSCLENKILPIVLTVGPHRYMTKDKLKTVLSVNKWINNINNKAKIIDYYKFTKNPLNDGSPKKNTYIDYVHPKPETIKKLMDEIEKW